MNQPLVETGTIPVINTVADLRDAQSKLQSLFVMVEACYTLEVGYREEGKLLLAEQAADRGERFSDWAEAMSDAIASARRRHGWGPY